MKMIPEHYAVIKKAMQEKAFLLPAIKLSINGGKRPKDMEMRIRWDLFNATELLKWQCDVLYGYLDDTHIDTALKSIMKELNLA